MERDSVDLFDGQGLDPDEVVGRIKLVDGKIVTEGAEWIADLIKDPHGDLAKGPLVDASEGRPFLQAVIDQYRGSGLRAAWTPE